MEHVKILAAAAKDIPAIVALVNSAYRGETSKAGWTTEAELITGEKRTDAEDIENLIHQSGTVILMATGPDNTLLGTVLLKDQPEDRLYLGMLSVNPLMQGAGIGKRMMKAAENYARQKQKLFITMQVISARSELIAWYQRQGYKDTGLRRPFPDEEAFGKPIKPLEFMVLEKKLD